ncbi:MAG: hypothetical protein RIS45_1564 [Planctomycetota bacterium]|jgi:hypothetical protein
MSVDIAFYANWYEAEPVSRGGAHWVSVKAHTPVLGHPQRFALHVPTAEDAELLAAAFNACSREPGSYIDPVKNVNWQVKMARREGAA